MKTRWLPALGLLVAALVTAHRVDASCPPTADLTILNSSYSTLGYVRADGTVLNSSYSTLGHLREDGTVLDSSYSTLGYIRDDGTLLNSSYSTLGYIRDDGTLLNSSYSTIGHIRSDGSILDSSYSTKGHVRPDGRDADAVAAYLFFFRPEMLASNSPPSRPELLSPENGALQVAIPVTLVWRPSDDPDRDPVSYQLVICPDQGASQCEPVEVAVESSPSPGSWSPGPALSSQPAELDGDTVDALWLAGAVGYPSGVALLLLVTAALLLAFRKLRRVLVLAALTIGLLYLSCTEIPDRFVNRHEVVHYHDVSGDGYAVTVEVEDLDWATTYYWRVVAFDGKDFSGQSTTWTFTTQDG